MFQDRTSLTAKQDAEAKEAVCKAYAKSFSKIKDDDLASKLLQRLPETPAKSAKETEEPLSPKGKITAKEVAASFDSLPASDDTSLERKSKRGMSLRFFVLLGVLTRV
jgi:hypothetical protein